MIHHATAMVCAGMVSALVTQPSAAPHVNLHALALAFPAVGTGLVTRMPIASAMPMLSTVTGEEILGARRAPPALLVTHAPSTALALDKFCAVVTVFAETLAVYATPISAAPLVKVLDHSAQHAPRQESLGVPANTTVLVARRTLAMATATAIRDHSAVVHAPARVATLALIVPSSVLEVPLHHALGMALATRLLGHARVKQPTAHHHAVSCVQA